MQNAFTVLLYFEASTFQRKQRLYKCVILMYHNLFMCLSIDEHLGCFCFLFILNNAAMNICVHTFWGHMFSILLGVYFRMDIQGCMVTVYLIF